MSAKTSEIVNYLDQLLDAGAFDDYCYNGLQVPGADSVATVATAVSANLETFKQAEQVQADLLLCHHGLFWKPVPLQLDEVTANRLRTLFAANIALAAYHLPLDAHPEFGNNALIAAGLGLEQREPFGQYLGKPIGQRGTFPGDGISRDELVAKVAKLTGQAPLVFPAGPDQVRSIGVISGGASRELPQAAELGLDAFITGEPTEPVMGLANEYAITYIAAGHYATETFGIHKLGELVTKQFGVSHVPIEVHNPI